MENAVYITAGTQSTGKTHRYPSWWEEWAIPDVWPDDNMLALTAHDYSKNRKRDKNGGAVCVHAPSDFCKVRLMYYVNHCDREHL